MVKEFLPLRLKYLMTDLSEVPMNTIIPVCEAGGSGVQLSRPPSTRERWMSSVCVHKPVSSCQQVSMCLSPFDQRLSPPQWAPPTYTHTLNTTLGNTSSSLTHSHTHTHSLPGAEREGCSISPSVHLCFGYQGARQYSSSKVSTLLLL